MKVINFTCTLVVTLVMCFSNAAYSATISALSNSDGMTLINDFETSVNNTYVTFSPGTQVAASNWADDVTPSGLYGVGGGQLVSGDLANATTSIGFWYGNDDFGKIFDVVLEVFFDGVSLGTIAATTNGNDEADQFMGLSSDSLFNSFSISYANGGGLYVYADDLYVGGNELSPVPVPAAAWLFGSALLGFAGFSRHRKMKAA